MAAAYYRPPNSSTFTGYRGINNNNNKGRTADAPRRILCKYPYSPHSRSFPPYFLTSSTPAAVPAPSTPTCIWQTWTQRVSTAATADWWHNQTVRQIVPRGLSQSLGGGGGDGGGAEQLQNYLPRCDINFSALLHIYEQNPYNPSKNISDAARTCCGISMRDRGKKAKATTATSTTTTRHTLISRRARRSSSICNWTLGHVWQCQTLLLLLLMLPLSCFIVKSHFKWGAIRCLKKINNIKRESKEEARERESKTALDTVCCCCSTLPRHAQ